MFEIKIPKETFVEIPKLKEETVEFFKNLYDDNEFKHTKYFNGESSDFNVKEKLHRFIDEIKDYFDVSKEIDETDKEQRKAIVDGLGKLLKGELTNIEKGNLCEMIMDQYYISLGYKPLHNRITSIDAPNHHGLDGVYEKDLPNGEKVFVIADAKYDQSPMGRGVEGEKQMSKEWQDKNLENTVGTEKAAEIKEAREKGNVKSQVFHAVPTSTGMICQLKDVSPGGSFNGKGIPAVESIYNKLLIWPKVKMKNLD